MEARLNMLVPTSPPARSIRVAVARLWLLLRTAGWLCLMLRDWGSPPVYATAATGHLCVLLLRHRQEEI